MGERGIALTPHPDPPLKGGGSSFASPPPEGEGGRGSHIRRCCGREKSPCGRSTSTSDMTA